MVVHAELQPMNQTTKRLVHQNTEMVTILQQKKYIFNSTISRSRTLTSHPHHSHHQPPVRPVRQPQPPGHVQGVRRAELLRGVRRDVSQTPQESLPC